MKTIIVTGAAGFIGSALAIRLLQNGENVIGVDDDGDWDALTDDRNGNGFGDYYWENGNLIAEPNVDENDENIPQRRELSIFPIIPTIGFSIELP